MLSLASKIIIREGLLFQELQGESVLLNLNTKNYYGLDEVGTRMWTVLCESPSIGRAIVILLKESEVERDILEKDIDYFLTQLLDKKLVELG